MSTRPFPVPVVSTFMGHQEDEELDYLAMPQGMHTYQAPILPEPEEIREASQMRHILGLTLQALRAECASPKSSSTIAVDKLSEKDLTLLNQILGEGEVAATIVDPDQGRQVRIQEAVFAGVWRVVILHSGMVEQDYIEVGAVPQIILDAAHADALSPGKFAAEENGAAQFMNVASLLTEIRSHSVRLSKKPAKTVASEKAHVINLSLLPVSPEDIGYIDHLLGTGRVTILSRGYGNCRITNCHTYGAWRVVYYNSQDTTILNTIEITDMPEAACAMQQDLIDSVERLEEVVAWVGQE